ncbi:MAG: hypothetical protein LBI14_03565 [Treponema sp.]|nr:hypothetical protein [Treponema sp.]
MSDQDADTQGISTGAYEQLSNDEISILLKDFQISIEDFFRGLEIPIGIQYTVCGLDLIDTILRVDKRIHYFKIFHGMECNEGKKAALYAYWISKFRPIMITDPRYLNVDGYNNMINELFAIHYLLSALCGMKRIELGNGQNEINLSLKNPFIKRLWYSLRFRNFTIDSIIVLADAITTDTFKLEEKDARP